MAKSGPEPVVALTYLLLPSFKEVAVMEEEWLHLVYTAWSHKNEIEYGEKTQLKIESTIVHLPEGKPTEESSKNMKDDFIPHIIG